MQSFLVKYETPIFISTTSSKPPTKSQLSSKCKASASHSSSSSTSNHVIRHNGNQPSTADIKRTEDILNSILPPREWLEDSQLWIQYVSSTPATRADVLHLQEELDKRLLQRQARDSGICPIREELYSEAFDELIRQVTVVCAERGLLLLRVRDEFRMVVSAYQALYESSIAFGVRKTLQGEQRRNEQDQQSKTLTETNQRLQEEIEELEQNIQQIQLEFKRTDEEEKKKHQEEVTVLKLSNQQVKEQLERILSGVVQT